MATHSSVLAWRIPGTGEPGGLPSMGSHRVGHDWSDLAAAAAPTHSSWSTFMGSPDEDERLRGTESSHPITIQCDLTAAVQDVQSSALTIHQETEFLWELVVRCVSETSLPATWLIAADKQPNHQEGTFFFWFRSTHVKSVESCPWSKLLAEDYRTFIIYYLQSITSVTQQFENIRHQREEPRCEEVTM